MVQTRSEENGLNEFHSLVEALRHADHDRTVWKISYTSGDRRVRLIRTEHGWVDRPLMDEIAGNDAG